MIIPLHLFDEETDLTAEVSSISPKKYEKVIKTIENFEVKNRSFIRIFLCYYLVLRSKINKKDCKSYLTTKETSSPKNIHGINKKVVKCYEGEMIENSFD